MDQSVAANPEQPVEDAIHATQESLDQVRDILFGSQMRDQDRRFTQVEEKFSAEMAAFRTETQKSVAGLETFIKTELGALASRLTAEAGQRQDACGQLKTEIASAANALEKRVTDTDAQHAAAEADLRRSLQEQATGVREEMKAGHAELSTLIEKFVADLSGAKTDRTALASLFTEMAGRLQA